MGFRQQRLDQYFPINRPRRRGNHSPFLELPSHIRQKIYRYSGLVRHCPIDLNSYTDRALLRDLDDIDGIISEHEYEYDAENFTNFLITGKTRPASTEESEIKERGFWRYKCQTRTAIASGNDDLNADTFYHDHCNYLPTSLLFVSRAIYQESMHVLYSENCFRVTQSGPRGLDALEKLGKQSLSMIRYLEIDLRRLDQSCIPMIHKLVDTMTSSICSASMNLNLLIDFDKKCAGDKEFILAVVTTLEHLRPLANCAIRLKPDPESVIFRPLAEVLAKYLVKRESTKARFERFLELPVEIQREIIQYAALAYSTNTKAPDGVVLWDYHKKEHNITVDDPFDEESPLTCCGHCSAVYRGNAFDVFDRGTVATLACFCSRAGSAYSTTCSCISGLPTHLFTVSRAFGDMAKRALFSNNTFVMTGYRFASLNEIYSDPYVSPNVIYDLTLLLPTVDLGLIRKLHLRFNVLDPCYHSLRHSDFDGLFMPQFEENLVDLVEDLDVEQLTLTLDFSSSLVALMHLNNGNDRHIPTPYPWPPADLQSAWNSLADKVYDMIGHCVAKHLTIRPRQLWYYLSWPIHDKHARHIKECKLEQMVMGHDYKAKGKPLFEPSLDPDGHAKHTFCMPGGCIPGKELDYRQYRWFKECEL